LAQTLYTYDVYTYNGGTLSSVTGLSGHDDSNYGTNNTVRGNVTLTQKLVGGSTYLNSYNNFDTTGQVTFAYDPANQKTSYAYGCQNAYPTTITNPLSQPTTLGYDCNTGLLSSIKDPNNQTTSFNYDGMNRPLNTGYPDGGQTTVTYNYSGSTYTGRTTTKKVTASQNLITTANTDGLGRMTSGVSTSDPDGQTTVNTVYDSNGRVLKTSNPYRSTSDPTYGWAVNVYDGLDRVIQTTHADGHISSIYYGASVAAQGGAASQQLCSTSSYGVGYPVLKIDEAGNKLQSWADAFGRIIEADEPTATSGNLTANTCYGYDLNNNLTGVLAADGIQTRSYIYDALSRLINAKNPETGGSATPTVYTYDGDGNCAAPNSFPGDLVSKVDPRGIRTCMQYDALHRLTYRSYSDGITPNDYFVYDVSSHWGIGLSNTVGRLTEEYTDTTKPWSASIFGYDPMGRVLLNNQCTPTSCGTSNSSINYTYDYLGDVATYTNGAGVTITQSPFSGAGRLTQITSSLSDNNNPPNHPGTLLSNVHYNALGEPSSATLGNGAVESLTYAPRGWPLTATVQSESTGTPGAGSVTINGSEESHTQNGYSSSQGPNTATSLADDGGANWPWTISGNGAYTGYTSQNESTDYLDAKNLGFNIPSNATINGVYVDVSDYAVSRDDDSSICDNVIQLIKGGVAQGSNKAWTCWTYPDAPPDDTYYGSSSDLWGLSLTPADVNSSNFGVRVQGSSVIYTYDVKAGVDFVTVTVYYTVPTVTTYDSGTVSVTVNSQIATVSYGQGSSGSSIASQLTTEITGFGFVRASASGNVISITSTTNGSNTNYSLSASSQTNYPQFFNPPSFTASPSGSTLTGGTGAPGTLYSFSLGYGQGNSNVTSANDSVNGNWAFTYDALNRLSTSNQNNNQNACSYGYDQLGNRTSQTATAGSCGGNLSLTYAGHTNRMDGYSYDTAGNLLSDGVHSYSYDAQNRIIQVDGTLGTWPNNCSTATACYNYDAEGRRVQKSIGAGRVEYLHDLNGNIVAELSSTGSWNRGEIFANGQHLATYNGGSSGSTYFDHTDWLGTERARSGMADANCETITNLPFGDSQATSGTCADASPLHFTGQQRDSEISVTNLDYFNARHYSSQFGRFMSPDPLGNVVPDPTNPQTWNQYAYVVNNPLTFIDPSGQEFCRTADWTGDDPNTGGAVGGLICDVTDDQYNQNPFTYGALNYQYYDVTGGVEQNPSECPGCGTTVFDSILLSQQQDQIAAQKLQALSDMNVPQTDLQKLAALNAAGNQASHDLACATQAMAGSIPFAGHLFGGSALGHTASAIDEAGMIASQSGAIAPAISRYATNLRQMGADAGQVRTVAKLAGDVAKYGPFVEEFARGLGKATLAVGVVEGMKDFNSCVGGSH
jgi:RHS repeat-associated protein